MHCLFHSIEINNSGEGYLAKATLQKLNCLSFSIYRKGNSTQLLSGLAAIKLSIQI
jgi:hypothetical protein